MTTESHPDRVMALVAEMAPILVAEQPSEPSTVELNWSIESPWRQPAHEWGDSYDCARCGQPVPPYWRHYMRPCLFCNSWSLIGAQIMRAVGLDPRGNLYLGARAWCAACDGTGYMPCHPEDLSIMRRSGACQTCGAWSFVLFHATKDDHSEIESSARHYDDDADHEVVVGAAPLVRSVSETLDRAEV